MFGMDSFDAKNGTHCWNLLRIVLLGPAENGVGDVGGTLNEDFSKCDNWIQTGKTHRRFFLKKFLTHYNLGYNVSNFFLKKIFSVFFLFSHG